MFSSFISGLCFSGSLIVAIGSQNAFVIRQALKRHHLFTIAFLCSSIDALLILLGVFGFGSVFLKYPSLLIWTKYFAVIFLFSYGLVAFRAAMKHNRGIVFEECIKQSMKKTIFTILAFSLLNPHVYLDTVVLLGSIASQEAPNMQKFFAIGAISASFLWFFSISYGSSACAKWLTRPGIQKFIDIAVGFSMWGIGTKLLIAA